MADHDGQDGAGPDRRARVPHPRAEGADPARSRWPGWPSGPAPRAGPMRSSWPPACNARSPHGRPTAARAASAPPASRPASAWRSSTSTTPAASSATRSPTWAPWTSSPRGRTWCSSAHPGPARPTWPSGWPSGPARPATGWPFATAAQWVARLADAHAAGRLQPELVRLGRYPLLVVDEVGYIPFEAEAANLFFQLVSARYERASLIVTSQQAVRPLGRGVRRRRRRRRHDRPPRPPRRGRRPQRRQLPAQGPRPRPRPGGRHRGVMTARGSVFTRRQGVSFRPSLTPISHSSSSGT